MMHSFAEGNRIGRSESGKDIRVSVGTRPQRIRAAFRAGEENRLSGGKTCSLPLAGAFRVQRGHATGGPDSYSLHFTATITRISCQEKRETLGGAYRHGNLLMLPNGCESRQAKA